jgi:hypothetical protein
LTIALRKGVTIFRVSANPAHGMSSLAKITDTRSVQCGSGTNYRMSRYTAKARGAKKWQIDSK